MQKFQQLVINELENLKIEIQKNEAFCMLSPIYGLYSNGLKKQVLSDERSIYDFLLKCQKKINILIQQYESDKLRELQI